MKRINGFIDLASCINYELSDLTSIEFSNLKNGKIILKDNNKYFFKRCKDDWCYREIIAYEIANYLNIPSVEYELAIIPDSSNSFDLGCISLDYCKKDHTYITGLDILLDYNDCYLHEWGHNEYSNNRLVNNLENIWQALEYRYRFDKNKLYLVAKLMYQLTTQVFLYDIFLANPDRHYLNWEIDEFENDANINVLFDNEDILLDYSNSPKLSIYLEERKSNWYKNLEIFLEHSSSLYVEHVNKMYDMLSPYKINELIELCEQNKEARIPLATKDHILKQYIAHYEQIGKIIKKTSGIKREVRYGA